MGVGSLVGALVAASRATITPSTFILAALGLGALLLCAALAPWYALTLVVLIVLGVFSTTYSSSTNTVLQLNSQEEYRGRVLSLYTLLFAGTTPIGGAITGALAEAWGIRPTMAVEAGICVVGALVGVLYLRRHPSTPEA